MIKRITGQEFRLSSEDIDRLSKEVETSLLENKIARKEVVRLRISLENALLNWQRKLGSDHSVFLSVFSQFGKICVELQSEGVRCDPFSEEDDVGDWARSLRESLEMVPSYDYIREINTLFFQLRKPAMSRLLLTLIFVGAGILVGFLGYLLPATVRTTVNSNFLVPSYDLISKMFTFVGMPLIFLCIANGIMGVGNMHSFSMIGRRMVLRYLLTTLGAIVLSLTLGSIVFGPDFRGKSVGVITDNPIIGITKWIPSDFFQPFINCSSIQLVVMGIVTGMLVLVLGNKTQNFRKVMLDVERLFLELSRWLTALIPIFVFCAIVSSIWQNSTMAVAMAWKPWVVTTVVEILVVLGIMLNIRRKEGVQIVQIAKKIFNVFIVALGTNTVGASIPSNSICCREDMGVDRKVYSFGISIGTTVFKPATAIRYAVIALFMAVSYNSMAVSPEWMLRLLIMSFVLSIATPAIPGGVVMMIPMLFNQMEIRGSSGMLAQLLAVDVFFDCIATAVNQIAVTLSLTSYASNLKLINKEIIRKKK